MGCAKVQNFNDLWTDFQKTDTFDIRREGKPSEFEREQRADQPLVHYWQLAVNGSHVYVIDHRIAFQAYRRVGPLSTRKF